MARHLLCSDRQAGCVPSPHQLPCSATPSLTLTPPHLLGSLVAQAGMGLIELRRIEAARDIAGTLAKSRNVVYLPSGGPQMLLGMNPSQ